MQLPTVHLNGTPKEMLLEQLTAASGALDLAYQALKEATPHGRDYYPQGPDALTLALAQHRTWLLRVDGVKEEVDALTVAIDAL